MVLQTVGADKEVTLDKDRILKAMKVAEGSEEATNYLCYQVEQIFSTSKSIKKSPERAEAAREVLKGLGEFSNFVEYKSDSDTDSIWSGKQPESAIVNMQEGIAKKAIDNLNALEQKRFKFDYAISNDGDFIRGYGSMTKDKVTATDAKTTEYIDQLFNAWLLTQHDVITEKGAFFRDGVRLSTAEMEAIMNSEDKSFKNYLAKSDIELVSNQREFKDENRLAQRQKAAREALERSRKETTMERGETPEVQREAPTPGDEAAGPSAH